MSPAQIKKYRAIWSKCRAALRSAGKPHDDAARYALHERTIGRRCSSTEFTQKEFDAVVGAMMAIVDPANFGAQMRQQDQEDLRREDVLCRIDDALAVIIPRSDCESDAHATHARASYKHKLADRMFGKVVGLTDRQLQVLMGVLEREARKRETATPKPAELAPF